MLRRQFPEAYIWILLWFILALFLLAMQAILFPQPTIAMLNQVKETLETFFFHVSQTL
jgi:hypothetical protein